MSEGIYTKFKLEAARRRSCYCILPSESQNDDVHVELSIASLDDLPVYEALSYVWGDPNITNPVILFGQPYQVTVNIDAALRRLRFVKNRDLSS
jgi:hypothetical protein